jgi:hypothetical protein
MAFELSRTWYDLIQRGANETFHECSLILIWLIILDSLGELEMGMFSEKATLAYA